MGQNNKKLYKIVKIVITNRIVKNSLKKAVFKKIKMIKKIKKEKDK